MGGVRMQDEWSLRGRKRVDLIVRDRAADFIRHDLLDLVTIDEPQSVMMGLDRDAVEEVQFGDLQHVLDLAKFGSGGRHDGSSDLERLVGDGTTVFLIH